MRAGRFVVVVAASSLFMTNAKSPRSHRVPPPLCRPACFRAIHSLLGPASRKPRFGGSTPLAIVEGEPPWTMVSCSGVISHSFMVLRSLGPDCEIGYDGDDHTVSGKLPLLRNQAHHGPNYVEPNLPPRIDSCTE